MKGNYFVYITTNPRQTVLYTGVTNDLVIRLPQYYQNRGNPKTFAGKYYRYKLLYYERYPDVNQAIEREKEMKDLSREQKELLIHEVNPDKVFLIISEFLRSQIVSF